MQFTKSFVSSVVAAASFASIAIAATCSPQSGCKTCESLLSMDTFENSYCANWQNPGYATYGQASATATGPFKSEADCFTAFGDIVAQCYGRNDGGDYQYDNTLTVYFCNCEVAAALQNVTAA